MNIRPPYTDSMMSHTPRQEDAPPSSHKEQNGGFKSFLVELFKFLLIAVVVVLPIRIFIAQPFIVSGASMSPSFEDSEYLIVDEISYRFIEPERGDVIIFRYPNNPSTFFIKRIIGLPNETISLRNGSVYIQNEDDPDGFLINENYLETRTGHFAPVTLSDDEYFVLGDNRTASSDSRSWGSLSEDLIIGRAFLRLLPVTKVDVFPGKDDIEIYKPVP